MELVPKAEFSIVTRASSKAWIPELIASAGPEVTETYIDFFTSTIRNRNTRAAYARACGVNQVPLQQEVMLHGQRHDHCGKPERVHCRCRPPERTASFPECYSSRAR